MEGVATPQQIITELYTRYNANGFITENEALACFAAHRVSLSEIDSITEHLLSMGVLIRHDDDEDYEDTITDRSKLDYSEIFDEVLATAPGLISFIEYVRGITPPQHREWQNLVYQAQNGNLFARNRLIEMYLRIVVKIALRFYKDSGFELDDAIQEGSMGLIRAISQYDDSKHGNLGSYFPLWIQQYISRAVVEKGNTIRIPVHAYELIQKIKQSKLVLLEQSGCEPSIDEIAAMSETTNETVVKLLDVTRSSVSLDYLLEAENGRLEINKYCSITSFDEDIESNALVEQVQKVLSTLTDRERRIITLRYGLLDGKERTLEKVGTAFNVTRERIRQIEVKTLKKLRHPSRAQHIKDFY